MQPTLNAYILLGDPAWICESVQSYYYAIERLVVSYDVDSKSWTGTDLPVEACLAKLRSVDPAGKFDYRPGKFSRLDHRPMENETYQRQVALQQAATGAEWVLQLDTDELLPARHHFFDALRSAHEANADSFAYPSRWLYQRSQSGRLVLERSTKTWGRQPDYPGPMALRVGTSVRYARQGGSKLYVVGYEERTQSMFELPPVSVAETIHAAEAIQHLSWLRSDQDMANKFASWGHAGDRDWSQPLARWRWAKRHPIWAMVGTPFRSHDFERVRAVPARDLPTDVGNHGW